MPWRQKYGEASRQSREAGLRVSHDIRITPHLAVHIRRARRPRTRPAPRLRDGVTCPTVPLPDGACDWLVKSCSRDELLALPSYLYQLSKDGFFITRKAPCPASTRDKLVADVIAKSAALTSRATAIKRGRAATWCSLQQVRDRREPRLRGCLASWSTVHL